MTENKIKEARKAAGLSQAGMAALLGIPRRTIEDWEAEARTPAPWAERLVVKELESLSSPQPSFKFTNEAVKRYADICKQFSEDTEEWGALEQFTFYTTDSGSWTESSDNANGGVDVSWAFHLSEKEIDYRAAQELYENLMNTVNLALDEGWDNEQLSEALKSFEF